MDTNDTKKIIIDAIESMKGSDITCLDVRDKADFTDYMIIANGTSTQHVKSIAQNISTSFKQQNKDIPSGIEGEESGEWVLVDLGNVIAHIMIPAQRTFYDLEGLWGIDINRGV